MSELWKAQALVDRVPFQGLVEVADTSVAEFRENLSLPALNTLGSAVP